MDVIYSIKLEEQIHDLVQKYCNSLLHEINRLKQQNEILMNSIKQTNDDYLNNVKRRRIE